MKTFRKRLARFLSLTLVLACVQIPSVAEAYNAETDIVMQAETDAVTNMYNVSDDGNRLGGLGSLDWDAVKACDLSEGNKVNKSVLAYAAYNVKAPAEGDYELKIGWMADVTKCQEKTGKDYQMTIKVNDGAVYKLQEAGIGTWGSYETPITVHLNAGNNVIYCIPYVEENIVAKNDTWVDMDYLAFASSTGLEAVSPSELSLKPSFASFVNLFNTKNSDGSLGGRSGAEGSILVDELTDPAKLAQVAYFSYTVSVPNDGYYDISMKYNTDGGTAKTGCFGFLVDGSVNKLPVDWCGNYKIANASVYLTAGTHSLTCTARIKDLASDAWNWSDILSFTIYGGAVRADYQINPVGGMSRMETELDATEIPTNWYHDLNAQNSGYSGYGLVGGCYGFDTNNFQTEADIKDFLDKRAPYMQYTVIAPADGQYNLKPVYYVSINSANAYTGATIKVNDNGVYSAPYGSTSSGFADTQVEVTLKKGRNVVTVIPFNANQKNQPYASGQWINQDYLGIDSRLVGAKDTSAAVYVNAGDSSYTGNFGNVNSGGGLGGSYPQDSIRILATAEGATLENIEKYSWYSITVTAPQDGYYELTETLSGTSNHFSYFACLADGTNYVGKKTDNDVRFYPYLHAGDNVLCFTAQIPRDKADWENFVAGSNYYDKILNNPGQVWTDISKVTLTGGLKLAATQKDPRHTYQTIQAEDTAKTFINESRSQVVGDHVGYANFTDTQDVESLTSHLDKEKTPYVAVVVDAPKAGNYAVGAYITKSIPNMADQYKKDGTVPMVTFKANDGAPVQAAFSGDSGGASLTSALVSLKEGRNVIYCMAVTQEERTHIATYDASISNHWADVDYINVDSTLTVVDVASVTLNAGDSEYINLYTVDGDKHLGGGNYGTMESEQLTIAELTQRNISKVPYFSYTVTAPKDGYYDITVNGGYGSPAGYDTYGMMVDGDTFAKKASNGNADFSVYLTEGNHVLVFTAVMPKDTTLTYQAGTWTDLNSVTLRGGLTKAVEQVSPGIYFAAPMEAETDALLSAYQVTDAAGASGGKAAGGATGARLTVDEMKNKGPVYGSHSYVAYAVYAPVEDDYEFAVGMQMGNKGLDNNAYQDFVNSNGAMSAKLLVNGTVLEAPFPSDAEMGWFVRVPLTIHLSAGTNVIYCMDIDSATAEALEGAYVNYDCLLIQDQLTAVDPSTMVVPGDANADRDVNVVDLVQLKKQQMNGSGATCLKAIDFDDNGTIDAADYANLIQILLDNPGAYNWLIKDVVSDQSVTAYSTALQYADEDTLLGYSVTDSTATVSVQKKNEAAADSSVNITVDTGTTYQTFEGFGASITDSSAINLYQLDETTRNEVMNALFSDDGLGLTFLRQPLGTSDFVDVEYTYCDDKGPSNNLLQNFSIAHDEEQIIPLIKEAQKLAAESGNTMHVFATPWTAPLWMKTQNDWDTKGDYQATTHNMLNTAYASTYAEYLAKAIDAYKQKGITIEAMTIQNEPDAEHYIPSMFVDVNAMNILAPKVKKSLTDKGLDTKILAYDFNWFGADDAQAGAARVEQFMQAIDFDGIAFHVYDGDSQVQKILYDKYKDTKKIYVTEAAGNVNPQHFFHQMSFAAQSLNTGASAYIGWNVMLDEDRGPSTYNPVGIGLTQRNNDGTWTPTTDYYAFAHYSKYIKQGAQIVKSEVEGTPLDITCTAAKNPDGSVVVVISNSGKSVETVSITVGDKVIEQKVAGKSAVTYVVK